jgi:hypothetical protein
LVATTLLVTPLARAAYQDWLVQQEHATVQHALTQAAAPGSLPVYMLTVNVLRLLPVLAGFGLLYYWIGGRQTESTRKLRELLIIPYLLIVGITVALGLRRSQAWPMPIIRLCSDPPR